MITTLFLIIAQAAMIEPPTGIGPPFWILPPKEIQVVRDPSRILDNGAGSVTIPEGVQTGLDVIMTDGPAIQFRVDESSEDGGAFIFNVPSIVPVPTQAEKDELMRLAREDAERRWSEDHPEEQ